MEVVLLMVWYEVVIGIVLILVSLISVALVLMQESRNAGLSGAIAGGAETFLGKNKGKSIDEKLVKFTKILATIFFVLALLSTLIVLFF